jgi:glycosyltransferase involved in cell wall biosynthesis
MRKSKFENKNSTHIGVAAFMINYVGGYHVSRLENLSKVLSRENIDLKVFQLNSFSHLYSHKEGYLKNKYLNINILKATKDNFFSRFFQIIKFLYDSKSDFVFVIGYSDFLSLTSLFYCLCARKKIFFLSESKGDDQPRSSFSEIVKSFLLRLFSGALVGGNRHKSYYNSLGFKKNIEIGYDVIDNYLYKTKSDRYKTKRSLARRFNLLPEKFVLCVSRLVEKKRVDVAISIYENSQIFKSDVNLLIIGNGPLENRIRFLISQSVAKDKIILIKDVKNTSMPFYYSQAMALLLASEYDQWGLCVNEAMACGVPAVVSERCGVAGEIVIDNKTGFIFRNNDLKKASESLACLVNNESIRSRMAVESLEMMNEWNLDKFSHGIVKLIKN